MAEMTERVWQTTMMNRTSALLLVGLATTGWSALSAEIDLSKLPPPAKTEGVTYAKNIQPILEVSCYQCHGERQPKAGLRLDSLEGVLKGSRDGKVLVPGKSEQSKIVIATSRLDPKLIMPPPPRARRGSPGMPGTPGAPGTPPPNRPGDAAISPPTTPGAAAAPMPPTPKPLTAEQVGLLRAWIDQGAK